MVHTFFYVVFRSIQHNINVINCTFENIGYFALDFNGNSLKIDDCKFGLDAVNIINNNFLYFTLTQVIVGQNE